MKVVLGKEGLSKTLQEKFPQKTECIHCGGTARIAFVAHECEVEGPFVYEMHQNRHESMWLHDVCAVAVYFCKRCLEPTARYNQA